MVNLFKFLQVIWDEIGEPDGDRDKMLLELEQECLEVYRRKVDQANRSRAQLRQAIAVSEAEIAAICSAMGERPVHSGQVCLPTVNDLVLVGDVLTIYSHMHICVVCAHTSMNMVITAYFLPIVSYCIECVLEKETLCLHTEAFCIFLTRGISVSIRVQGV